MKASVLNINGRQAEALMYMLKDRIRVDITGILRRIIDAVDDNQAVGFDRVANKVGAKTLEAVFESVYSLRYKLDEAVAALEKTRFDDDVYTPLIMTAAEVTTLHAVVKNAPECRDSKANLFYRDPDSHKSYVYEIALHDLTFRGLYSLLSTEKARLDYLKQQTYTTDLANLLRVLTAPEGPFPGFPHAGCERTLPAPKHVPLALPPIGDCQPGIAGT